MGMPCDLSDMHTVGRHGEYSVVKIGTEVVKVEFTHGWFRGRLTSFEIECMGRAIANHDGDVHNPFLGSDSTMVAAHQLDRKCYGMELDPTLEVKKNGRPYKTGS